MSLAPSACGFYAPGPSAFKSICQTALCIRQVAAAVGVAAVDRYANGVVGGLTGYRSSHLLK